MSPIRLRLWFFNSCLPDHVLQCSKIQLLSDRSIDQNKFAPRLPYTGNSIQSSQIQEPTKFKSPACWVLNTGKINDSLSASSLTISTSRNILRIKIIVYNVYSWTTLSSQHKSTCSQTNLRHSHACLTSDWVFSRICAPMTGNFGSSVPQSGNSPTKTASTRAGCIATNRLSFMERALLWAIVLACNAVVASICAADQWIAHVPTTDRMVNKMNGATTIDGEERMVEVVRCRVSQMHTRGDQLSAVQRHDEKVGCLFSKEQTCPEVVLPSKCTHSVSPTLA